MPPECERMICDVINECQLINVPVRPPEPRAQSRAVLARFSRRTGAVSWKRLASRMGSVGRARRATPSHAEVAARAQGGTLMKSYRHPYNAGQHNKKSVRSKHPRGLAPPAPQSTAAATLIPSGTTLRQAASMLGVSVLLIVAAIARWSNVSQLVLSIGLCVLCVTQAPHVGKVPFDEAIVSQAWMS